MASYHFRATIIGRTDGHSAVAAAAYRANEKLLDERTGITHDYSGRSAVTHSEIMLPEGVNPKLGDRSTLWNAVEASEKRSDAQLARSIVLALPHELTEEQRLTLTRDFVQEHFVDRGMIADVAIHRPVAEKNENSKNHHAHVLLTLRQGAEDGLRETKTREWNSRALVDEWREAWSDAQNTELERHDHKDRVDHRTLKAQSLEARENGEDGKADAFDRPPEETLEMRIWNMAKEGKLEEELKQSESNCSEAGYGYADAEQALVDFDEQAENWRSDYQPIDNSPAFKSDNSRPAQNVRIAPALLNSIF